MPYWNERLAVIVIWMPWPYKFPFLWVLVSLEKKKLNLEAIILLNLPWGVEINVLLKNCQNKTAKIIPRDWSFSKGDVLCEKNSTKKTLPSTTGGAHPSGVGASAVEDRHFAVLEQRPVPDGGREPQPRWHATAGCLTVLCGPPKANAIHTMHHKI